MLVTLSPVIAFGDVSMMKLIVMIMMLAPKTLAMPTAPKMTHVPTLKLYVMTMMLVLKTTVILALDVYMLISPLNVNLLINAM
jgi:hypothetical protein